MSNRFRSWKQSCPVFFTHLIFHNLLQSQICAGDKWPVLGVRRTHLEQVIWCKKCPYSRGTFNLFKSAPRLRKMFCSCDVKKKGTSLQPNSAVAFSTWRVNPKCIEEIVFVKPSPVRILPASFHIADAYISAFDSDRSHFSFSIISTLFTISRRHANMAFMAASFSNITVFNCLFFYQ